MNKDILIDAMSMIPDDLLMEADAYQGETPKYYIPRKPGFIKRYKKLIKISKYVAIVAGICLLIVLLLVKESKRIHATDLMDGVKANKSVDTALPEEYGNVMTEFAVGLFQNCYTEGENILLSPLSVISAIGMTANGAKGETLEQIEDVLGTDIDTLNIYIYSYAQNLFNSKNDELSLANSIWFDERRFKTVQDGFLQKNADYYGADLYKREFDEQAKGEINKWVDNNTNGMIKEIIDVIPEDTVMYLINALAFEAEWEVIYRQDAIRNDDFTTEEGIKKSVPFMFSSESVYLEDDYSVGFMKYYKNKRFAFVALLPNEDIKLSDYIAMLDGNKIATLLRGKQNKKVYTKTPKFKVEYIINLKNVLRNMGINEAFDENNADFSNLGTPYLGTLYIGGILHKTFIQVDEKGTKAGAATAVSTTNTSALADPKEVNLDRPFVYMLVDCESNIPFMIGAISDIHQ